MRIISGKYKGLKINAFNIEGTRPTMDRVKESLFGIIQNDIKNSICLDLFAGSGSLGFEAISNGAEKVILNDNNKIIVKILNDFISKNNIKNVLVTNFDFKQSINTFKEEELDIILLDPPYQNNLINESITLIEKNKILKINGLIVCEYTSEHINCNYELIKNKKYGDKYISIYKRTQ